MRDALSKLIDERIEATRPSVTHRCPRGESNVCPCCDRTPFELPHNDRITADPRLVTCANQLAGNQ